MSSVGWTLLALGHDVIRWATLDLAIQAERDESLPQLAVGVTMSSVLPFCFKGIVVRAFDPPPRYKGRVKWIKYQ